MSWNLCTILSCAHLSLHSRSIGINERIEQDGVCDELDLTQSDALIRAGGFPAVPSVLRAVSAAHIPGVWDFRLLEGLIGDGCLTDAQRAVGSSGIFYVLCDDYPSPSLLDGLRQLAPGNLFQALLSEIEGIVPHNLSVGSLLRNLSSPAGGWQPLPRAYGVLLSDGDGSTPHADFYNTAFWNALLYGGKVWVLWSASLHQYLRYQDIERVSAWSDMPGSEWFESELQWVLDVIDGNAEFQGHLRTCETRAGDVLWSPGDWWHVTKSIGPSLAFSEQMLVRGTVNTMFDQICWGGFDEESGGSVLCKPWNCKDCDEDSCHSAFKDGLLRGYMCAALFRVESNVYASTCCDQFLNAFAQALKLDNEYGCKRMLQGGHSQLLDFVRQRSLVKLPVGLKGGLHLDPMQGWIPKFSAARFLPDFCETEEVAKCTKASL